MESCVVCVRGFSEGKSEASKRATNFGLAKTSNFLYTLLPAGFISCIFPNIQSLLKICRNPRYSEYD